jgi:RND family efflux transporter MFP subunit
MMTLRKLIPILVLATLSQAVAADEPVSVVGLASAVYDAALGSTVPGVVEEVGVSDGQTVKQGDVLLVIERDTEDLEVQRRNLIWQDKSQLEGAIHRLDTLRKDIEATRTLYETSRSVRLDELEKKELEVKLAESYVEQMKTVEKREEIEYLISEEQKKLRQINAPTNGVVTKVFPEKGEYVQQHEPLIRLVNLDRCYLTCNVEASLGHRFKTGAVMSIRFESPQATIEREGTVVFVSPMVDPASGLKEIKLVFDNEDHAVSPGVQGTLVLE